MRPQGPACVPGVPLFLDTRTPENLEARLTIMPLGQPGEGLLDEITRHLGTGRQVHGVPFAPSPSPPAIPPATP